MAAYMRFSCKLVLAMPAPRLMLGLIARVIHVPRCVTTSSTHPRPSTLVTGLYQTGSCDFIRPPSQRGSHQFILCVSSRVLERRVRQPRFRAEAVGGPVN